MKKIKAIILDRDGVLIEDKNYAYKLEDFELLPGVIEGLKILQEEFIFFIVTNQSGIGKGYYSVQDFYIFNNHLIDILNNNGISIERTFFCPHLKEENCDCRKPNQRYIYEIKALYHVDSIHSWMIGDHPSDIQFGIDGGFNTIFLTTGHGKKHIKDFKVLRFSPTFICENFLSAAKKILEFSS